MKNDDFPEKSFLSAHTAHREHWGFESESERRTPCLTSLLVPAVIVAARRDPSMMGSVVNIVVNATESTTGSGERTRQRTTAFTTALRGVHCGRRISQHTHSVRRVLKQDAWSSQRSSITLSRSSEEEQHLIGTTFSRWMTRATLGSPHWKGADGPPGGIGKNMKLKALGRRVGNVRNSAN